MPGLQEQHSLDLILGHKFFGVNIIPQIRTPLILVLAAARGDSLIRKLYCSYSLSRKYMTPNCMYCRRILAIFTAA